MCSGCAASAWRSTAMCAAACRPQSTIRSCCAGTVVASTVDIVAVGRTTILLPSLPSRACSIVATHTAPCALPRSDRLASEQLNALRRRQLNDHVTTSHRPIRSSTLPLRPLPPPRFYHCSRINVRWCGEQRWIGTVNSSELNCDRRHSALRPEMEST